jgi:ribose transport system substrate-binding protein
MDRKFAKLFAGTAAVALALSSVSAVAAQDGYKMGVSNTLQGNGWREEMICSIKAQALASGEVSELIVAHRNTDAAGQLEDLRNLIAAGVDAIIVNPVSPDAVNDAVAEAIEAGIVVVAVDMGVTQDGAFLMSNDQEEYGYLGAKWLFEQVGGEGDIVYMRGIAGSQADTDRDNGFKRAQAEFPGINVVAETFTGWDQATGAQQINDIINSGQSFDGIWTSGIDSIVVSALNEAGVTGVPVVGADNSEFVNQLGTQDCLLGAAVTNPGSVGGAGVTLALQILNGEVPGDPAVLVAPDLWDNQTAEGQEKIQAAIAASGALDPFWPVSITIPDWTTYSEEQILACKGPGEE